MPRHMLHHFSFFGKLSAGLIGGIAVLSFCGVTPVFAEGPVAKVGAGESFVWDSNPLTLSSGEKDIYGYETKIFSSGRWETPSLRMDAGASVIISRFSRSGFNSADFHGNTGLVKKGRRGQVGLDGRLDYDTTRTGELTTFGRNINSVRRVSYSVKPSVSYSLSRRSRIALLASWLETRYDDSSLVDYRVFSVMPSVEYDISPLQQVALTFQAQRYQLREDTDRYIDSLGPSFAWRVLFSPSFSAEFSAGFLGSKSHGYSGVSQDRDWNSIFSASLDYNDEQHRARISAVRSRQPYSNGSEEVLTTFSANEQYRINPRLSLSFGGSYKFAETSDIAATNLDDRWNGQSVLSYDIAKGWKMQASYRYEKERLVGAARDSDRSVVRAGLSYQFEAGR